MSVQKRGIWPMIYVLGLVGVIGLVSNLTPKAPSHPVTARVVQIYTSGARFPHTVIIAQAPHAMEAHAIVRDGEDCRLGDRIGGVQTGVALRVDPLTCRRP
jgi:hypothetical protein